MAHCNGGCGSDIHLKNLAQTNKKTAILIGPEGDFSEKEVQLAEQNGWIKIGLGSERLRTETAGIVKFVDFVEGVQFDSKLNKTYLTVFILRVCECVCVRYKSNFLNKK